MVTRVCVRARARIAPVHPRMMCLSKANKTNIVWRFCDGYLTLTHISRI
jgi:hypothetical protein